MRIACYCRYSSDNQREESIEGQLRAIQDWSEKNDHVIVREYIDRALSAKTDDRPEFLRMIKDSKNHYFDAIVVHKLDRFSRSRYDSAFYKKKLKENGIKLYSVLENFSDDPESIILESVLEGMNEYYIANLAREVQKGKNENAYECKFNGGTPPLGYDIDSNKKYIINEDEAKIVKYIYELYLNGYGLISIAQELNKNGYKSKIGRSFTKNSITDILRNEKYTGVYIYNKTYTNKKRNFTRNDEIRIENGIPIIISKEVFNMVQMKREENRKNCGTFSAKRIYLFAGLVKCGKCGGNYVGWTRKCRGTEKRFYMCSSRNKISKCEGRYIDADELENAVYNILSNKIFTTDDLDNFVEGVNKAYQELNSDAQSQIENVEKAIKDIDNKITNIVKAISTGINSESLLNELKELESNKSLLNDKKLDIASLGAIKRISKTTIEESLKKDLFNSKALNKEDLKQIYKKYIKKIEIHEDYVDIYFNLLNNNSTPSNNNALSCMAGLARIHSSFISL